MSLQLNLLFSDERVTGFLIVFLFSWLRCSIRSLVLLNDRWNRRGYVLLRDRWNRSYVLLSDRWNRRGAVLLSDRWNRRGYVLLSDRWNRRSYVLLSDRCLILQLLLVHRLNWSSSIIKVLLNSWRLLRSNSSLCCIRLCDRGRRNLKVFYRRNSTSWLIVQRRLFDLGYFRSEWSRRRR